MGFTITESVVVREFGLSAPGFYVTIHATYAHGKGGDATHPYYLQASWMMYATQEMGLQPLRTDSIVVPLAAPSTTPFADLYAAIKAQCFPDKTCVDT